MVTPCLAENLQGLDKLRLLVIRPSVTSANDGLRYRCPVAKCTYIGATLGHAGECLKHLKDCKHDPVGHAKFWRKTFVCFQNADGKGILNTRPCYDSAPFAFIEPGVDKPQTAYTKVRAQRVADFAVYAAKTTQDTSPCLQLGGSCSLCSEDRLPLVVQTCSCCPRGFCERHAASEAVNAQAQDSKYLSYFICDFCQHNPLRIEASYTHKALCDQGYFPQELLTAHGEWVSMYMQGSGPGVSAKEFSTSCFEQDLRDYESKV